VSPYFDTVETHLALNPHVAPRRLLDGSSVRAARPRQRGPTRPLVVWVSLCSKTSVQRRFICLKSASDVGATAAFILLRSPEGSVLPAARRHDGVEEGVASSFDTVETRLAPHLGACPSQPRPLLYARGPDTRTVLVIEDDGAIALMLQDALELGGYRVVLAVGSASLAVAVVEQPALILLDIRMPEMDGPEVSRRLRADPATASIPIVAMSAHLWGAESVPVYMAHDAYLAKPFGLMELWALVARLITASAHRW